MLSLVLFALLPHASFAQLDKQISHDKSVDISVLYEPYDDIFILTNQYEYYLDEKGDFQASNYQNVIFQPVNSFSNYQSWEAKNVWIKTSLVNSSDTARSFALHFSEVDESSLYQIQREGQVKRIKEKADKLGLEMQAGESMDVLIHWRNSEKKNFDQGVVLYSPEYLDQLLMADNRKGNLPFYWGDLFFGAILILLIYHFFLFLQNRQKIYLAYCGYILALAFHFALGNSILSITALLNESQFSNYTILNYGFQPFIYFFYALYTRMFWNTKKEFPKIDVMVQLVMFSSVICSFVMLILRQDLLLMIKIFDVYRYMMIGISVIFLVYFFSHYRKDTRYYLIGASAYFIFALIAFVFAKLRLNEYSFPFLKLGAIIEVLFFAFALGYRMKMSEQEKLHIQEDLVEEYKKNENLQLQLQDQLEQELEILKKEKEIGQLEAHLLRSRMNPHFIFNSLNSLKLFVLEQETEQATVYLDKFVRILRQILNNTANKLSSLQSELDMLEDYLWLEKERMMGGFDFEINWNENESLKDFQIPTMLLQPFLENSIWHGVKHLKERSGLIKLNILKKSNALVVEVDDNGVGRLRSSEINKSKKHKSAATQIVYQRLQLLELYDGILTDLKIIDKPDHGGTTVRLKFTMG